MLHLLNTMIVRRESCTFNICSVHFRAVGSGDKLEYFSSSLVLHLLNDVYGVGGWLVVLVHHY